MKKITKVEVDMENLYQLSNQEIAVIHALTFYNAEGMTPQAQKVNDALKEQFNMHKAVGDFKVWR